MAHRTFTDARGRDWQVWEVRPGMAMLGEAVDRRRRGSDRRTAAAGGGGGGGGDQRQQQQQQEHLPERRVRHERRIGVSAPLRDGWLAFRCGDERRRLAPVPHGWDTDTELQLAAYCQAAQPVNGAPADAEGERRDRSA